MKSDHQRSVEQFMEKAGQDVPRQPIIPSTSTRFLRACLILEEALETIKALGFEVQVGLDTASVRPSGEPPNIVEIVDGCCDIAVVTTGTLSAFGVSDLAPQRLVNESNLKKFGPGGHKRDDGKWIKPSDWKPPALDLELIKQGYRP